MHPILASGQRQALYLASWALIGLLLAVAWSAASSRVALPASLAVVVPPCLLYGFICLSAWYVCRAAPLAARSVLRVLATHAGAGLVATLAWMLAWEGWVRALVGSAVFDAGVLDDYRAQLPVIPPAGVMLFWLSSMLHYLLIAFEASRRAEARELGFEVRARACRRRSCWSQGAARA